jgi:hypothetical protein
MKNKILFLGIFVLSNCILTAQNGEKINNIGFQGISNHNLTFAVYTSILGGIDDYTVEYEEAANNNLNVNILCSQNNPTDSYSEATTTFSINSDLSNGRANVYVRVRSKTGGTDESPQYGDYRLVGSTTILLLDFPEQINEIQLGAITEDSLLYNVLITTSILGEWLVEYEANGSTVNVNIFATVTDRLLCYCPFHLVFSLKKDTYSKAIITAKSHQRTGGTLENPIFSVWSSLGYPKEIDLPVTNAVIQSTIIENNVDISPNPVKDMLFVDLKDRQKTNLKIYNLQGNLLLDKNIDASQYVDVSYLNSGMYLVTIDNQSVNKLVKE